MKRIGKRGTPSKLALWYTITTENNYAALTADTETKTDLRQKLAEEQFYLCAYTGMDISNDNFHIEHIYPQEKTKRNRKNGIIDYEDTNYSNMLACYPNNILYPNCPFGANFRGTKDVLVSPLSDCDRRFHFKYSGKVAPRDSKDQAACKTIKNLALDHKQLVNYRFRAINNFFGFGKNLTPITNDEALKLLQKISTPKNGKLRPFCFALKQLLEQYIA